MLSRCEMATPLSEVESNSKNSTRDGSLDLRLHFFKNKVLCGNIFFLNIAENMLRVISNVCLGYFLIHLQAEKKSKV